MTSPGALIACAMLAKPSLEPSVATTCVSGLSFTPKRRGEWVGRGRPQAGGALRRRQRIGAGVADGFDQLVDDVLRRRHVGVAHAEVDDVGAIGPCRRLQPIDLGKNVRWKPLDAMELFDHVSAAKTYELEILSNRAAARQ